MRSVWLACVGFVVAALIWALYSPLSAHALVLSLGVEGRDLQQIESELIAAGPSAVPALRQGLLDTNVRIRLRCAHILSIEGDRRGDQALLEILRQHGEDAQDPIGAMAESFLSSVWEERDGPPDALRARLLQPDGYNT